MSVVAIALAVAAAHFGPAPCGTPHVTVVPSIAAESPLGRVVGEAWPSTCQIEVVSDLTPEKECLVLVHEYGHLTGLGHSRDPRNVMAPSIDRVVFPPCQRFA